MSRRAALPAALLVVAVLAPSCARSETLGTAEAVEVMVLDGLGRAQADCIVSALDGQLDLAKVTGLETDLDDDELILLASTSSRCAPVLAPSESVTGRTTNTDDFDSGASWTLQEIDDEVERRVGEGLDATVADCVVLRLTDSAMPGEVLADDMAFSELVVDCRDGA